MGNYRVLNMASYAVHYILISEHKYALRKITFYNKEAYYKELVPGRLRIEIDKYTGKIRAYKRGASYLSKWKAVRVKWKWIKELENLIYPNNIIEGEIL
jgi:hypothetical protein